MKDDPQRAHGAGYELISTSGITLFGYEVLPGNVCKVTVNLYAEDGGLVAESTHSDFKPVPRLDQMTITPAQREVFDFYIKARRKWAGP